MHVTQCNSSVEADYGMRVVKIRWIWGLNVMYYFYFHDDFRYSSIDILVPAVIKKNILDVFVFC